MGAFVGLALICLLLSLTGSSGFLVGAFVFGFSVLPLSAVFKCQAGWPRFAMTAYTAAITGAGLAAFVSLLMSGSGGLMTKEDFNALRGTLLAVFLIGILLAGWVANFLMMQRPKR